MLLRRYHDENGRGEGVTTAGDVNPSSGGVVSEDAYSLDELKDQARELDLPVSGTKSDLVERINAKLAEQGE